VLRELLYGVYRGICDAREDSTMALTLAACDVVRLVTHQCVYGPKVRAGTIFAEIDALRSSRRRAKHDRVKC
jgi:hypothetical protein